MLQFNKSSAPPTGDSVSAATASPAALQLAELADTRRVARAGLLALLIGFGGFVAWAALAPLDQGVPSMGYVSVDTKRKVVQHHLGGIVQQVFVREGQWVDAQQPLLRLDDSVAKANYEAVRQQLYTLKAVESRLMAEQQGLTAIVFDAQLLSAAQVDPKLSAHMNIQTQLAQARRQSVEAGVAMLRETAIGHEAIISSSGQIASNLKLQTESMERELQGVRDMVKDGYLPVSRQLEMERMLASLRSQAADNSATQIRARQSILELRQREVAIRADYRKEIEQQMAQLRPEIQTLSERFKALSEDLARVEIRSPAKGQVVGLTVQTVGGVIQAGQRLLEVVPANESLVVEARVESHLIDRVAAGAEVDLRFASFANTPQLVVLGRIMSISSDTVTDPTAPQLPPYYLARIEVTPDGVKELGSRKLQPGMPVDVVFKTGQRTLLDYIIRPLTKRMAASLKEE